MRRLFAWPVVLFLVTAQAFAQAASEKPWVSLFDGRDLSGWKTNGSEKWVADDGAILGESRVGKYGYLTTEKTYRDFNLRLRFKCETDGNSGVFTRSRITGESPKTGPDIEGMQSGYNFTPEAESRSASRTFIFRSLISHQLSRHGGSAISGNIARSLAKAEG
jgi:hypothetical protein